MSFILIELFNLIDVVATLYFYRTGCFIELNPFMDYLLKTPVLFVIVKVGVMTLLLLLIWRERTDKYAKYALRFGLVVYGIIAVYYCIIWFLLESIM